MEWSSNPYPECWIPVNLQATTENSSLSTLLGFIQKKKKNLLSLYLSLLPVLPRTYLDIYLVLQALPLSVCLFKIDVFPNCKSIWIKVSAKWLNVNAVQPCSTSVRKQVPLQGYCIGGLPIQISCKWMLFGRDPSPAYLPFVHFPSRSACWPLLTTTWPRPIPRTYYLSAYLLKWQNVSLTTDDHYMVPPPSHEPTICPLTFYKTASGICVHLQPLEWDCYNRLVGWLSTKVLNRSHSIDCKLTHISFAINTMGLL